MNYLYLIGCLILGMIFYHFLKGFCGCRVVEGVDFDKIADKFVINAISAPGTCSGKTAAAKNYCEPQKNKLNCESQNLIRSILKKGGCIWKYT